MFYTNLMLYLLIASQFQWIIANQQESSLIKEDLMLMQSPEDLNPDVGSAVNAVVAGQSDQFANASTTDNAPTTEADVSSSTFATTNNTPTTGTDVSSSTFTTDGSLATTPTPETLKNCKFSAFDDGAILGATIPFFILMLMMTIRTMILNHHRNDLSPFVRALFFM